MNCTTTTIVIILAQLEVLIGLVLLLLLVLLVVKCNLKLPENVLLIVLLVVPVNLNLNETRGLMNLKSLKATTCMIRITAIDIFPPGWQHNLGRRPWIPMVILSLTAGSSCASPCGRRSSGSDHA